MFTPSDFPLIPVFRFLERWVIFVGVTEMIATRHATVTATADSVVLSVHVYNFHDSMAHQRTDVVISDYGISSNSYTPCYIVWCASWYTASAQAESCQSYPVVPSVWTLCSELTTKLWSKPRRTGATNWRVLAGSPDRFQVLRTAVHKFKSTGVGVDNLPARPRPPVHSSQHHQHARPSTSGHSARDHRGHPRDQQDRYSAEGRSSDMAQSARLPSTLSSLSAEGTASLSASKVR